MGCVDVMSELWYSSLAPECTQSVVSLLDGGGHVLLSSTDISVNPKGSARGSAAPLDDICLAEL